jgi:hypothetical protein
VPRRNRTDLILLACAVFAFCVTGYFALRYGSTYQIGDSEYRRSTVSDRAAVFMPGLALNIALGVLAVRRLIAESAGADWPDDTTS